jgi:hypothetical protein
VAGALRMDVEAAFLGMAKEYLVRQMRKMNIDECLVKWMLDIMSNRSVKMVVDG